MITNDDVNKLTKLFATKDELTQLKNELFDKMDVNYSKIFNLVDGLAVEINKGRESRAIFSYRIEDLEKRMKTVEKNLGQ